MPALLAAQTGYRTGGGQHKDAPRHLLRQSVVAHRRPVADGRWRNQRHRNLELMERTRSRDRPRKRVEPLLQPDNPTVAHEVMEGLTEVARREAHGGCHLTGGVSGEDTPSFRR